MNNIGCVYVSDTSDEAQKLYARLFLRKHRWIRAEKIFYKDIASDLTGTLKCLCASGLLLDGEQSADIDL